MTALVRRGDLPAIKLGGRGQWRIERSPLEEFIQRAYEETERELRERRDGRDGESDEPSGGVDEEQ
ncbi:helix-turn-helix domain-containing protein [Nocardioides caldifontis]|uniref:helix-turn-helix domain-containing protein n=1 Tax=Nocardioides caldifontis TaxID=2588938 RepID=UPI0011DFEEDF